MTTFPTTKKGLEKMELELKKLKTEDRPEIIQAIADAKAYGDLSENFEYKAAKEKQSQIEGKIFDLENKISQAEVIEPEYINSNQIQFGATVTLLDLDTDEVKTYLILGEYEADLAKSILSIFSPLAKEMLNKQVGDEIELTTVKHEKSYKILKIEYKPY
jgi:transcription elongation factor GreA